MSRMKEYGEKNEYEFHMGKKNIEIVNMTSEEAEIMERQSGILAVEENIILSGFSKEDSLDIFSEEEEIVIRNISQWNLDAIKLVRENELNGDQVKVEVLDSGCSYTEDIEIIERVNLIEGEEEVSEMFDDGNGHGTGICGMIAAKDNEEGITGINPNAEIYSVKAFDSNLQAPLSRVVEGIYWGIDNNMDIINMSFGTSVDSIILRKAIQDASDAGILLIAASGNTPNAAVQFPGAYPEVIAVGSTNASGQIAEHTSTGEELELLAPGKQVVTTGLFDGVLEVEGTSIAAAQITAVASLLISKDNTKSPEFIRQLLRKSAKDVNMDDGNKVGLVDYAYSLDIYDEFSDIFEDGAADQIVVNNAERAEDYSEEADAVITGLWSGSENKEEGHYSSTVWAGNLVGGISSRNIKLMAISAKLMDYENYSSFPWGEGQLGCSKIRAIHGRGNYVMNLSFLWETAIELTKNSNKDSAIKEVYERVIKRCNPTGDELKYLKQLKEAINSRILSTNMIEGGESDGESRKFKLFGAAMHMIGDICAHRAMVPVDAAPNFDPAHFGTENKTPSDAELKLWLKHSLEMEYHNKLRGYANWASFQKAIRTGSLEFRDTGKFILAKEVNGELKKVRNYADDTKFYSVRYTITRNASTRLLKANSLAASRRIMIPKTHFIKFNNLKGYFIQAGGSSDLIDYWSKVSTNGLV